MEKVLMPSFKTATSTNSICGQQLFRSLRVHHNSPDQMKILKDQSVQSLSLVAKLLD